jgi:ACS family tartrate transporter-like MFS transporter
MALELEAATMRKVALRFLPLLGLCYTINVLDRFNVSIAALTMNKALGLSATTYGLGAGAFFWSYILFQVPANAVLSRVGARRWITLIAVAWGLCSRPALVPDHRRGHLRLSPDRGIARPSLGR